MGCLERRPFAAVIVSKVLRPASRRSTSPEGIPLTGRFRFEGTPFGGKQISPPPTPSRPDAKPASAPVPRYDASPAVRSLSPYFFSHSAIFHPSCADIAVGAARSRTGAALSDPVPALPESDPLPMDPDPAAEPLASLEELATGTASPACVCVASRLVGSLGS